MPKSLRTLTVFVSAFAVVSGIIGVARPVSGAALAPPAVTITAPAPGSAVAGTTTVLANASPDATRAELYVDGVLQGADNAAPFAFPWNTAANPLPPPNHQIDFGYMLVDGRYGDFRTEVNSYTNLYHAWARRGYEAHSGVPDDEWLPIMQRALADAAAQGRRITMNLNLQETAPGRVTPVDRVLDIAAPFWSSIVRIELADEPGWTRAETEAQVDSLHAKLRQHGLPVRPVGAVYDRRQGLTDDAVFAVNLDFVVVEAYVDPPGSGDSQVNIDFLVQTMTAVKNRIPADKQLGFVMQAYARNGGWTDIDTLRDLQIPTYLLAYNDPRVVLIEMFSYGRGSGTREHPEITTPHRLIGERILGQPNPTAGKGLRTLVVKAYDAAGNSAVHRITVRVQSSRPGDFMGDPKADVAVWRPSDGKWFILHPPDPPINAPWGQRGDIPVPGDFIGDTRIDLVVFRPSAGAWLISTVETGQTIGHPWGAPGDIPVSGDFIGDGRADLALFRPSDGVWYIREPNTGEMVVRAFGTAGDIPLAGDFLGDTKSELVVYRPSAGAWFILNPRTGESVRHAWGTPGDTPFTGDFLGDGRTELTVFRPSTGQWFVLDRSTGETTLHYWGVAGDIPVAGDYFGDGRTELTVFRPSQGLWGIRDPNNGATFFGPWGKDGDIPVA